MPVYDGIRVGNDPVSSDEERGGFDSGVSDDERAEIHAEAESIRAKDVERAYQTQQGPEITMDQLRMGLRYGALNRKATQTGPKGVLKDYHDAKMKMRARRIRERVAFDREIERNALGAAELQQQKLRKKKQRDESGSDTDSDFDSLDDEDDEFFEQWQQQRVQQIRDSMHSFGELYAMTAHEFAAATGRNHTSVWTVCNLADDLNEKSVRLDSVLQELAPQCDHVLFVSVPARQFLGDKFNPARMPALILLQGDDQKHYLPCLDKQLGSSQYSSVELTKKLAELGVPMFAPARSSSVATAGKRETQTSRVRWSRHRGDLDIDDEY